MPLERQQAGQRFTVAVPAIPPAILVGHEHFARLVDHEVADDLSIAPAAHRAEQFGICTALVPGAGVARNQADVERQPAERNAAEAVLQRNWLVGWGGRRSITEGGCGESVRKGSSL